ncbi:MAG: rod shape-determining protein, partial [Desulfovibrionaceae bacterium]|nr:rod shape-determining protein [Desulfovibrionaceae bacterium]
RYMRDVFKLSIGESTAEKVKMLIGSAMPIPDAPQIEVYGKDLVSGAPKVVRVGEGHIREALRDPVNAILNGVFKALEKTPPELAGDIYRNGMLLAGGGALLKGLDQRIARETRLRVIVDNDPLTTVLRGTGKTLDNQKFYKDVYIN